MQKISMGVMGATVVIIMGITVGTGVRDRGAGAQAGADAVLRDWADDIIHHLGLRVEVEVGVGIGRGRGREIGSTRGKEEEKEMENERGKEIGIGTETQGNDQETEIETGTETETETEIENLQDYERVHGNEVLVALGAENDPLDSHLETTLPILISQHITNCLLLCVYTGNQETWTLTSPQDLYLKPRR